MTKEKKIAFQGIHGSYSDVACRSLQPGCETIGHDSFKGCIDAVLSGAADFALIPIENSATGTYLFNYDLIDSDKLFIVNEYLSHEQHCLLALPGTKLADVTVIKSHPYAIDQCRGWLDTRAGKSVTVAQAADTAGVAKEISAGKLTNV